MATYKEIQDYIKDKHQINVKTCWIAHVKEIMGIQMRKAPNRISGTERVSPCPQKHVQIIIDALNHFSIK
jgi:hypothetical protein